MTIEQKIFSRKRFSTRRMDDYGFVNKDACYSLSKEFMDGDFTAEIRVYQNGSVQGRVMDNMIGEEYIPLRMPNYTGAFVGSVRAAYEKLLLDIADKCCSDVAFVSDQSNRIAALILDKYSVEPDFPWDEGTYETSGVFRHGSNNKWFGLIMNIDRRHLEKNAGEEMVDVINLKADENKMIAERVITKKASERIARAAFNLCIKRDESKVTCVHKSNVLKKTDGIFKESFYNVAEKYPQIKTEDYYVDAMAMYLITQPQNFDVIVSSNLFGDILSDESAGLVGGLGLAPSGNIGDHNGLFEPIHGSAPDIAGKNIANPCSMILSASMMLDYLGEWEISNRIKESVEKVIADCKIKTPDLGGNASTMEMTKAIVKELI